MEKDQVAELCYHLPEAAHERLCQTREEIRLLADLTARINDEADHLQLSPSALARCFDRLADQLDQALHESFWPPTRDQAGQPKKGAPFRRPGQ
ncbi:MAG: hypothetical protein WAM90_06155 [Rhodanobacter sp.]